MGYRMRRAAVWIGLVMLVAAAGLSAADRDSYVRLPNPAPGTNWKKYLGEIGSDTLATFKYGKTAGEESTVSMVWFQNLYTTRDLLEKTAPALKAVLANQIHKNDTPGADKYAGGLFGLKPGDKDSLVVFYEFKVTKASELRKVGAYRYYYIYKKIDAQMAISLGVEVQLRDPAHADAIDKLLADCGFRTTAEVEAGSKAEATAANKPAAAGEKPADAPVSQPADAPAKPAMPVTPVTETPAEATH